MSKQRGVPKAPVPPPLDRTVAYHSMLWRAQAAILGPALRPWLLALEEFALAGPELDVVNRTESVGATSLLDRVPSPELYRQVVAFAREVKAHPARRWAGQKHTRKLWLLLIAEHAARADADRRGLRGGAASAHVYTLIADRFSYTPETAKQMLWRAKYPKTEARRAAHARIALRIPDIFDAHRASAITWHDRPDRPNPFPPAR
jgi:hypothetical protein